MAEANGWVSASAKVRVGGAADRVCWITPDVDILIAIAVVLRPRGSAFAITFALLADAEAEATAIRKLISCGLGRTFVPACDV